MDHLELIAAQLTKEGMLAYDSIQETSIAANQEMILFQRRAYFDALNERYTPDLLAREPTVISFCYPLVHMIATGQLFEPYFYHPDADVDERRSESDYCLERLAEWVARFDKRKLPKNMEMDWDGEWLSPDLVGNWNQEYIIPEVTLQMNPLYHPTKYVTQSNAVRMILPAKGMLPLGSYIGSPCFGLIHPTTISAAVLQDAGFQVDAITLAPNFDFVTGRNRMEGIVGLITLWTLIEPEDEECLAYIPPDDLSYDDFYKFSEIQLNRTEPWDRRVHQMAYDVATNYTEDQLLTHHMATMLINMGT